MQFFTSTPRSNRPLGGLVYVVTLPLLLCLGACQQGDAPKSGGPKRPPALVEIWPVSTSVITDRVDSIGTLLGNESVEITAKVTDVVEGIYFEDGQMVEAGDLLVSLVDAEQEALLQEAAANLREAELQLTRLERLGSDISTGAQLDVSRARVKASRAQLEAIASRLADHRISAPFAGQLGFREVSPGALVTPGTVITQLDDIRTLKLDFTVAEAHFARLAVGNPVAGTSPAWPGGVFRGEVVSIGSRIDPVSRAVTVRAVIDNSELKLRPGMLMSLELTSSQRDAIVVPEEALIQVAGQSMVYTVDTEGKAERRRVEIGKRVSGGVEITAGLSEADTVVTKGQFTLRPGAAVRVAEPGSATGE